MGDLHEGKMRNYGGGGENLERRVVYMIKANG